MRELRCREGRPLVGVNRVGLMHIFKFVAQRLVSLPKKGNRCLLEQVESDTRMTPAEPMCVTCRRCQMSGFLQRIDLNNSKDSPRS